MTQDGPADTGGSDCRAERIWQIVNDCLRRRENGESVTDESIIEHYPELMPELGEQLRNLHVIQKARRVYEGATTGPSEVARSGVQGLHVRCPHCRCSVEVVIDTPLTEITCSSCGSTFSLVDDETLLDTWDRGRRIAQFELVERLGVGGFGAVWKARDTELDRFVAVKIPRAQHLDPAQVEMFFREARAAAQLQHPSIVNVHEVGREGDTIYIVSDLAQGIPLSDWGKSQPYTPHDAARLCRKIAEALHHAHEKGIIHRDLKPHNIMIDGDRQPQLMDFGLARREAGEVTMTLDGQVLGTPAYMSPEQAQGESHRADRRSDVYSLGVILFELLTGELPFRGNARMLIQQVIHEEAPSPRKLNGNVPRDLETVCLKCLEKDPRKRFTSAAKVGEELGRVLSGEAIEARPISTWARAWRWCKRKPAVSSLAAGLVAALLAGLVGVTSQWIRADKEAEHANLVADKEEQARREAAARAEEADRARRRSDQLSLELAIDHGVNLCKQARVGHGLLWLAHGLEIAPVDARDLRRVIRANLADWRRELHAVRASFAHPRGVLAVTFSSDGKTVLTECMDGKARLWDADTGQLIGAPLDHGQRLYCVAISPDGSRILTGGGYAACLWNARTGKLIQQAAGHHKDEVQCVAFSPDGRRFVTGSREGTFGLWDAGTADLIGEPLPHEAHKDCVRDVAFSPDGSLILTGSWDKTARLWDARTLNAVGEPLKHQAWVWGVAFSPDGSRIVTGCGDGTIHLRDVDTQKALSEPLRHRAPVHAVAFHANGTRILTGHFDNTGQLWETATRNPIGSPIRHQGPVEDVKFSPQNDRAILTSSVDGTARVWEPAAQRLPSETLRHHHAGVQALAFSPDESCLLTGSQDHTAQLWDLDAQRTNGKVLEHQEWVWALAFSADGSRILTGCGDGSAQLWNANTGETIGSPLWHSRPVGGRRQGFGIWAVAFSPDGSRFAVGCTDNTASVWDAKTYEPIGKPLEHEGHVASVAFSPDSTMVLTGSADGTARLWDVATTKPLGVPLRHEAPVNAVAYGPSGKKIATGCEDGRVYLWDPPSDPLTGDVEQTVLWTQVVTGQELDADGAIRNLDTESWLRRRQRLHELGGPPSL